MGRFFLPEELLVIIICQVTHSMVYLHLVSVFLIRISTNQNCEI